VPHYRHFGLINLAPYALMSRGNFKECMPSRYQTIKAASGTLTGLLNSPQYVCEGLAARSVPIVRKSETLNPVRCSRAAGPETVLADLRSREARTRWSARMQGTLAKHSLIAAAEELFVTVTASSKAKTVED